MLLKKEGTIEVGYYLSTFQYRLHQDAASYLANPTHPKQYYKEYYKVSAVLYWCKS